MPIVSEPDIKCKQVRWWPGFSHPPLEDLPSPNPSMPADQRRQAVLGRQSEIQELVTAVRTAPIRHRVLVGTPGSGKTTVALAAAADLIGSGVPVYWLLGQNPAAYMNGLVMVAADVGAEEAELHRVRESGDVESAWRLILERGREAEPDSPVLLLVVDNIADPALYRAIHAKTLALVNGDSSRWFVLLTASTRVTEAVGQDVAECQVIDPPGPEHAAEILRQYASHFRSRARRQQSAATADQLHTVEIAETLGRLPLALRLAGQYLRSSLLHYNLQEYSAELRKRAVSPEVRRVAEFDVAASLLLPVLMLGVESASDPGVTLDVLRVMSVFRSSQPLPELILEVANAARENLVPGSPGGGDWLLQAARSSLMDLKLLETAWHPDPSVGMIAIHPVVIEAVRNWPGKEMPDARIVKAAVAVMDAATRTLADAPHADATGGSEPSFEWQLLEPHIMATLEAVDKLDWRERGVRRQVLGPAIRTVDHFVEIGMLGRAASMAARTARVARRLPVRDYLDTLSTVGTVRLAMGNPREAFKIFAAVHLWRQRHLGPKAQESIRTLRDLAAVHHALGHLEVSEAVFKQSLRRLKLLPVSGSDASSTKLLESDDEGFAHRRCLASVAQGLALVLHAAGRPQQSLALLRLVENLQSELGTDHPEMIAVKHSLAYVNQAIGGLGSLDAAEVSFAEVLRAREAVLGDSHPDTLMTRHNLAWIKQARNDLDAACAEFEQVRKLQLRRLGPEHPHFISTTANLAWTLLRQGEYEKARVHFGEVLEVRRAKLGDEHPDTQTTRGNIAWLTLMEGRAEEAENLLRPLLLERERRLSERHPRTLTTKHNLALSLRRQDNDDKLAEAEDMFRNVLKLQREVPGVGEKHASTLATKNNLALTIRARGGNLKEAARLLREVLEVPSPNDLTVLQNLGFILRADDEVAEADAIDRRIDEAHRQAAQMGKSG